MNTIPEGEGYRKSRALLPKAGGDVIHGRQIKCKVNFTFLGFENHASAVFAENYPKKAVFRCQIGLQTNGYKREQLLN